MLESFTGAKVIRVCQILMFVIGLFGTGVIIGGEIAYDRIRRNQSIEAERAASRPRIPPDSASVAVRLQDGTLFGVYHIAEIRASAENCTSWSFRSGWTPVRPTVEPPIITDAVTHWTPVDRSKIKDWEERL